jgi:hypothetical protein
VTLSLGDGNEAPDHRVPAGHDAEEALDLVSIADELGPEQDVLSAQADMGRFAFDQVQLPLASPRCQQRLAIADVADRLSVVPTALAAGQVDKDQPFAQ